LSIDTYNPLHKKHLGKSVAEALLERAIVALPPERFSGAGIYAIYYTGNYPAYKHILRKMRTADLKGQFMSARQFQKEPARGALAWMLPLAKCCIRAFASTPSP